MPVSVCVCVRVCWTLLKTSCWQRHWLHQSTHLQFLFFFSFFSNDVMCFVMETHLISSQVRQRRPRLYSWGSRSLLSSFTIYIPQNIQLRLVEWMETLKGPLSKISQHLVVSEHIASNVNADPPPPLPFRFRHLTGTGVFLIPAAMSNESHGIPVDEHSGLLLIRVDSVWLPPYNKTHSLCNDICLLLANENTTAIYLYQFDWKHSCVFLFYFIF